jgi:hypothetical protein
MREFLRENGETVVSRTRVCFEAHRIGCKLRAFVCKLMIRSAMKHVHSSKVRRNVLIKEGKGVLKGKTQDGLGLFKNGLVGIQLGRVHHFFDSTFFDRTFTLQCQELGLVVPACVLVRRATQTPMKRGCYKNKSIYTLKRACPMETSSNQLRRNGVSRYSPTHLLQLAIGCVGRESFVPDLRNTVLRFAVAVHRACYSFRAPPPLVSLMFTCCGVF